MNAASPPPGTRRRTAWTGSYFDGRRAARQPVAITVMATGLRLAREDGSLVWWPYSEIRLTQGALPGEQIRLERGTEPSETLVVSDEAFLAVLREATPRLFGRAALAGRRVNWFALGLAAGVAVAAIGLAVYFWGIPRLADAAATRIPVSWEERLGQAVTDHLAPPEQRCRDAERIAVLDRIVSTLMAAWPPSPYTFRTIVADDETINAFAAPGGYLVINRGLLRRTRRPEELAGVLAHEIQHVLQRHGTKALFREVSTNALIAMIAGDAGALGQALETAGTLGGLRYRRDDEETADREGMRMLQAARIDPSGMIGFFELLREDGARLPRVLEYLSTHPQTEDRIERLKVQAAQATYMPIRLVPGYPWREMAGICRER